MIRIIFGVIIGASASVAAYQLPLFLTPAWGQEAAPQRHYTADQVLKAYVGAGWFQAKDEGNKPVVCISKEGSDYVDNLVSYLAARARQLIGS